MMDRIHLNSCDKHPKDSKHCNEFNSVFLLDTVFLHNSFYKPLEINKYIGDSSRCGMTFLTSPTLLNAKQNVAAMIRTSPRSGLLLASAEK